MSDIRRRVKVKTGPKVLAAALVIGMGVFGARWYVVNHGDARMASVVPTKAEELEDFKEGAAPATKAPEDLSLPSDALAKGGAKVKMLVIPWNSQMGLALANGGPRTT